MYITHRILILFFLIKSQVCVWWNQFDCQSAPSLYGNNAYIYDYSKTGQPIDSSNTDFGGQGPSNGFDGFGSSQSSSPGFGAQPGFQPSGASQPNAPGFGPSQPSANSGFGAPGSAAPGFVPSQSGSSGFTPSQSASPGFGPLQSGSPGFGTSVAASPGYPVSSPPSGSASTGFGQPGSSHSIGKISKSNSNESRNKKSIQLAFCLGFGQTHLPGGSHTSHSSAHNVPSNSHSFASGADQYPAAIPPNSQTDYPSAIIPTIPSSPAPFGAPGIPSSGVATLTGTGYPPAGTPTPINTPINTPLTGEQPSREYLPSRRTK